MLGIKLREPGLEFARENHLTECPEDERFVYQFLWAPKTLKGATKWLKTVKIKQTFWLKVPLYCSIPMALGHEGYWIDREFMEIY